MWKAFLRTALAISTFGPAYGQKAGEKPPAFDAASLKPVAGLPAGGRRGGAQDEAAAAPPVVRGPGSLRFRPGNVASAPGGVSARKIILEAYRLSPYQLSGGPAWLDSDRFELQAKAEGAGEDQLRQMLQTLLADRFRLVVHRETRELPVYLLSVAKGGCKLKQWQEGDPLPAFGSGGRANNFRDRGTMQHFADFLSNNPDLGRPVVDKTGLAGVYVFYAEWDDGQEFLPAWQVQFGLALEPAKAPLDVLTIVRVEKPTAN